MEAVYNNINQIDSQVDKNKQKIDEIHRREVILQEETFNCF